MVKKYFALLRLRNPLTPAGSPKPGSNISFPQKFIDNNT